MELIVDDRERGVIPYLKKIINVKVERITVGDYAFIYNGKVIVIVERKSLSDLASSIKDGRMENNDKLLHAQKTDGCKILYIIEGSAYPNLERKICGIKYKCLQGKLDSILFRHDIKIIWTKDCYHTATRIAGLFSTFTKFAKEGVFTSDKCEKTNNTQNRKENSYEKVIKLNRAKSVDSIHINMLTKIKGISHKTAMAVLNHYNIIQLFNGELDEGTCYNIKYCDSGFKLGSRGSMLYRMCKKIDSSQAVQEKILACVSGITLSVSKKILNSIKFKDIITLNFENNKIANIQKTEKRKIGPSIEKKIRLIFNNEEQADLENKNDQYIERQ